jgi:hypothetical protein
MTAGAVSAIGVFAFVVLRKSRARQQTGERKAA